MSVGYSFQANSHFVEITNGAVIFRYINNCYFLICKQKFWFQKRKHSQLSLKRSRVHIEMNYEKFKRSDRPDRFRSLTLLSTIFSPLLGKSNDYLRIDTKRFPISVK